MKTKIFIDYQILDHLLRIEDGSYKGKYADELRQFRNKCAAGSYDVWVADISEVEMIKGRENPKLAADKLSAVRRKDARKLEIARELGARRLGYPCSKLNDDYSRSNVSFRTAGPNWPKAQALEKRLLQVPGVSPGDARQLVTVVYGHCDEMSRSPPSIKWLVTEDVRLRTGMQEAVRRGEMREFEQKSFVSVADYLTAQHL